MLSLFKSSSIFSLLFFVIIFFSLSSCKKSEVETKLEYDTISDIDGNKYKVVKIGDQWWMTENLRVSKFNDGTVIEANTSTTDSSWIKATQPRFQFLDSVQGILYNGYVVNSVKKIAPKGWRIPTDEDWKKLEAFIGLSNDEIQSYGWRGTDQAEQLVIESSVGWLAGTLLFGNNNTGFNAIPSGCYVSNGYLNKETNSAFWWSSTIANSKLIYRNIDFSHRNIFRHYTSLNYGFSIRCVKE
jgi:uncharacterized protein (TIGR02145 family)